MQEDLNILLLNIKDSLDGKPKLKKGKPTNLLKTIKSYLETDEELDFIPEYRLKDFETLKDRANEGINLEKVLPVLDSSLDSEAMVVAITEFNQKMVDLIPVNLSETIFGLDEREPSDFEKSQFIRKMRVIENPDHLLDLLLSNQMSPLEVETAILFYPSYYQILTEAALEAISELHGEVKAELPPSKSRALALMLGVPRLTPAILKLKEEEKGDPAGEEIKVANMNETEVQSTLKNK